MAKRVVHASEFVFDAHILVVEDNDINALVLGEILTRMGCTHRRAVNGVQGLEMLEDEAYDLVLMDVQMPVMDGLTAVAKLREQEQERGESRQVVLALTANALAGDKEMCLNAGMDDYLTKPVTMDNISQALRRWLHGQEKMAVTKAPETKQTKSDKPVVTIDLSQLRATFGDAADGLIPQLLTSYLAEGVRDMEVLRQANDQTDMALLVRIVHNLKSSSATLGIGAFSALCREAEQLGRQGDRAAMLAIFPQVVEQFGQVRIAAEALLASMQAGGAPA
jgi:CheY-like chemotaxis protein/HPt (histidine-containing phosphotransfer) domain-containing protein